MGIRCQILRGVKENQRWRVVKSVKTDFSQELFTWEKCPLYRTGLNAKKERPRGFRVKGQVGGRGGGVSE